MPPTCARQPYARYASVTLQVKHEQITKLENNIYFQSKNMTNFERTLCFLGHNSLSFLYCDHILLLGAKIELTRVGELSLAEHLQGAGVTLVRG